MKQLQQLSELIHLRTTYAGTSALSSGERTEIQIKVTNKLDELILSLVEAIQIEPTE